MATKKTNRVNEELKLPVGEAFELALAEMLAEEDAESGNPIVLVLIDTDCFDHINKDYGFDVGDQILIDVGNHIKKYASEEAKLYRVGGDEFAIIFHDGSEKEEVFLRMEDLRKSLDVKEPNGANVTVTIGIAVAFENASREPELVRAADSAMYRAKYRGRNRVALAKEEKMVPKTSHYTTDQLTRLTQLSKREGIGEAVLLREAIDMLLKKYDI